MYQRADIQPTKTSDILRGALIDSHILHFSACNLLRVPERLVADIELFDQTPEA